MEGPFAAVGGVQSLLASPPTSAGSLAVTSTAALSGFDTSIRSGPVTSDELGRRLERVGALLQ